MKQLKKRKGNTFILYLSCYCCSDELLIEVLISSVCRLGPEPSVVHRKQVRHCGKESDKSLMIDFPF